MKDKKLLQVFVDHAIYEAFMAKAMAKNQSKAGRMRELIERDVKKVVRK